MGTLNQGITGSAIAAAYREPIMGRTLAERVDHGLMKRGTDLTEMAGVVREVRAKDPGLASRIWIVFSRGVPEASERERLILAVKALGE